MDDPAAVEMVLAGDKEAFAVLVERHGPAVLRLARRMTSDRGLAEDIAQETFLRAYSRLAAYDPRWPFKVWLLRIASNLCVDALRRRKLASRSVSMDAAPEEATAAPREAFDPSLEVEERETAAVVRNAVEHLPPEYRLLVVMAHFEGMRNAEIAQATGLSSGLVKNRLYRARQMLREKLSATVSEEA